MAELTQLQTKLTTLLPDLELRFEEPMHKHTSFRIGGPAEVMAFPKSVDELSELLKTSALLDLKPAILGAGTNILAPDEGIRGLVICLKDCLSGMEELENHRIRIAAGVTMTRAAVFAANLGLGGMEFVHGIPGTIGGGIYMNAGAYGGELKDICEVVDVMDYHGNVKTIPAEDMAFSYRHSILEEVPGIVVSAVFRMTPMEPDQIKSNMKELQAKRSASQPLDLPSAGSAYKRPVGCYAAAMIDEAGLKGYTVGGAAISAKHAGFAVNLGGATASDVRNLLQQVSDIVFEKTGIRLESEIQIW